MKGDARVEAWIGPAGLSVAALWIAWAAAYAAGFAYPPRLTEYSAVTFLGLGFVLAIRAFVSLRKSEPPLSSITPAVVVGIILLVAGSSAFGALKAAMPKVAPFWFDQPLMQFELWLFGAHPMEISQRLLGWATPAIDRIYATFLPSHLIATMAVLTMKPSQFKTQALVTLFLAWLVGIALAYFLSSAGPIFYSRVMGVDLFPVVDAPITVKTADLLWHFHSADRPMIANGISAMPSMHVALNLWLALLLNRTRFAAFGWAYFALIWLGSVHLGWHYASDGLLGSAIVLVIWKLAELYAHPGRVGIDQRHAARSTEQEQPEVISGRYIAPHPERVH